MPNKVSANEQVKAAVDEVLKEVKLEKPKPSAIKTVKITLDRERNLRMSLRAMKEIEDETGLNPWSGGNDAWAFKAPRHIAVYLWACLKHEDPDLTIDNIMELEGTELSNLPYVIDKLSELWGFSMPDPESSESDADPN